jgi:hypothetical protein
MGSGHSVAVGAIQFRRQTQCQHIVVQSSYGPQRAKWIHRAEFPQLAALVKRLVSGSTRPMCGEALSRGESSVSTPRAASRR